MVHFFVVLCKITKFCFTWTRVTTSIFKFFFQSKVVLNIGVDRLNESIQYLDLLSKIYLSRLTFSSALWPYLPLNSLLIILLSQEIIKVREWIPHIGPLTKVICLKLFLDIVPSSFADITRALRGCFRGGSVYVVSFHFKAK